MLRRRTHTRSGHNRAAHRYNRRRHDCVARQPGRRSNQIRLTHQRHDLTSPSTDNTRSGSSGGVPHCPPVVPEQFVAKTIPTATLDRLGRPECKYTALRAIPGSISHAFAQVGEVTRAVEPSRHTVVHKIERTPAARRNDRNAARKSLLHGLAEGLMLARMNKNVETGEHLRELCTTKESREMRRRQNLLEVSPTGSLPHNHESHVWDVREHSEVLHLFLGSKPTHVTDDGVTVRCDLCSPRIVPTGWPEPLGVDPPPPELHLPHPHRSEPLNGRG